MYIRSKVFHFLMNNITQELIQQSVTGMKMVIENSHSRETKLQNATQFKRKEKLQEMHLSVQEKHLEQICQIRIQNKKKSSKYMKYQLIASIFFHSIQVTDFFLKNFGNQCYSVTVTVLHVIQIGVKSRTLHDCIKIRMHGDFCVYKQI